MNQIQKKSDEFKKRQDAQASLTAKIKVNWKWNILLHKEWRFLAQFVVYIAGVISH